MNDLQRDALIRVVHAKRIEASFEDCPVEFGHVRKVLKEILIDGEAADAGAVRQLWDDGYVFAVGDKYQIKATSKGIAAAEQVA